MLQVPVGRHDQYSMLESLLPADPQARLASTAHLLDQFGVRNVADVVCVSPPFLIGRILHYVLDNTDVTDGDLRAALLCAAMYGHDQVMVFLLHLFDTIDVNAPNDLGETALMIASKYGHLQCVYSLLNRNEINPNVICDGDTAVIWASREGRLEIVKALIDHPALNPYLPVNDADMRFDEEEPFDDINALQNAARAGHLEIVRLLADKMPHAMNDVGRTNTPAMIAIEEGHTDIFLELLPYRAEGLNGCDELGDTPLILAVVMERTETVLALLSLPDIKVNVGQQGTGSTALHYAVSSDDPKLPIIHALLCHPQIDFAQVDDHGTSMLEIINGIALRFVMEHINDINKACGCRSRRRYTL